MWINFAELEKDLYNSNGVNNSVWCVEYGDSVRRYVLNLGSAVVGGAHNLRGKIGAVSLPEGSETCPLLLM